MPLLGEEHVVAKFLRKPLVEPDTLAVEGNALRGAIVCADDSSVASAVAATHIALLQDGDVGHPTLPEVIGGGQPVHTCADDHGIVAVLEEVRPPHPLFPKLLQ